MEAIETGIAARRDSTGNALRDEQQRLLSAARTVLDTVVLQAADGAATLTALQREFPGAALLREYEGWRFLADHEPARALERFDALLRASRRSSSMLRGRARALEALDRQDEATLAWQRVLDAAPADVEAFDHLMTRHQAAGTLGDFQQSIARLRLMHPRDTMLLGREVRVLQQLGLPDSAAALVQRFMGGTP